MQEAQVKNAQQAYDRAQALLRPVPAPRRRSRMPKPRCARRRRASTRRRPGLPAARRSARSRDQSSRSTSEPANGAAGRPVLALLPPRQSQGPLLSSAKPCCRSSGLASGSTVRCDGCADGISAPRSVSSRATSEFTPPVIYSQEERSKLVFLIEARPEQPERLARRPAGQRPLAAEEP